MFPLIAVFVIIVAVLFCNNFHFEFSCHVTSFANLAEGTGFEPARR